MSDDAKKQVEGMTGISNLAYDLMIVLANKLEGIAAMEEYKADAEAAGDDGCRAAFERMQQQDREAVADLRGRLVEHLGRS